MVEVLDKDQQVLQRWLATHVTADVKSHHYKDDFR